MICVDVEESDSILRADSQIGHAVGQFVDARLQLLESGGPVFENHTGPVGNDGGRNGKKLGNIHLLIRTPGRSFDR